MSGAPRGMAVRLRAAFGLGSSQALVRLVCSFISIKLTAVYLGPAGLALIAQFNNLVTLGQGLLGAGVNTAMVRLTAEYADQPQRRGTLWATCLRLSLALGVAGLLLLLALSPLLARRLFTDGAQLWIVWLAGAAIVVSLLNSLLLGALNGRRAIAAMVKANVAATVLGLLVFAPACMLWGTAGGIVGSLLSYCLSLATTLCWCRLSGAVRADDFRAAPSAAVTRQVLHYYPMLIAHATLTPLSVILVRDAVISTLSLDAAGLWQGAWRLSEVYTTIITTSVSLYFMPRLGELASQPAALRREVWRTLGAVTAVTAAMALGIYLLRDLVVKLVFSAAFDGVQQLMPVQLLGDVLKMSAWTLGFVLVATLRSRWYMAIEIVAPAVLVASVHLLTPRLGAVGAMWAYVLAGLVQLLMAVAALRALLFHRSPSDPS
ncbi:MAG: O-antigen translocase [Pseudomonadota bacterium]